MQNKFSNQTYSIDDIIMKRPASSFGYRWRDSTPIGNGLTGAYFYGGTSAEHLVLNRSDLWSGGVNAPVPDVSYCLKEMRELQAKGKYQEANFIMYNELQRKNYGNCLADMRTLGCVNLSIECRGIYNKYRRVIHMATSEAEVSYFLGEDFYQRKYLALRKRDIIAIKFESEKEMCYTLNSGFFRSNEGEAELAMCKADAEHTEYKARKGVYIYSSRHEGHYFGIACRVVADGKVSTDESGIKLEKSKNSLLLIKAFSEETDRDEAQKKAVEALNQCPDDYQILYDENIPLYTSLYNTSNIQLSEGKECHSNEELISNAKDTGISCELAEKLWRFGRYMFISGTSVNGLPFPLYGLWNAGYKLPFTHNVANENVQSIYWHTDVGGLSELVKPLINYYYNKMEFFRENARNLYCCRGIFVGTYTTPKNSTISWEVPVILHFNGVAGWLSQHFYKYYLYSGDTALLEEKILPFMIEVAEFYEDFYYTDNEGKMVLYPAVSPENTPHEYRDDSRPHAMVVTKNPTVEFAILKELLTNLLELSVERKELAEKAEIWTKMLQIIPEYNVDENGVAKEWMTPELSDEFEHRHLSHIYPLFPGTEFEDNDERELITAFGKAVDARIVGSFWGWSMGHMASIYARMQEEEKVYETLNAFVKTCLLDNFLTLGYDYRDMGVTTYECGDEFMACVQLDALMGYVNSIQEMLLFSGKNKLKILPACPKEFNSGKAKLHFQTGVVEFEWDLMKNSCHGVITSRVDVDLKLILPIGQNEIEIKLKKGESYKF